MLFHPSPGGTLLTDDMLVLFNGANFGTAAATGLFTPRYALFVVHSKSDFSGGFFSRIGVVGAGAEAFEEAFRRKVAQPATTTEALEAELVAELPEDQVLEIPPLKRLRVRTGAMNNGFYFKRPKAWFWSGFAIRGTELAETLEAFVERHGLAR